MIMASQSVLRYLRALRVVFCLLYSISTHQHQPPCAVPTCAPPAFSAPVKLRLGDEVTFTEPPHVGHRGETIVQEGFVHSFVLEVITLAGYQRREMRPRCTYKKHRGYLSAAIAKKNLSRVVPQQHQQPQHGSNSSSSSSSSSQAGEAGGGDAGNNSRTADGPPPPPPGKGKQPAAAAAAAAGRSSSVSSIGGGWGSSLSGGKFSSSAGVGAAAAASADRSVQSWGQGRCEHVAAGEESNYKNGKVRRGEPRYMHSLQRLVWSVIFGLGFGVIFVALSLSARGLLLCWCGKNLRSAHKATP